MHITNKSFKIKSYLPDEAHMQVDFKLLEDKVLSLVKRYEQLQQDTYASQERIATLSEKNKILEQKIEQASKRIENLIAHLPGAEHVG